MRALTIPRAVATRLLGEAQRHPTEMVCGLVGARDGEPCSIYPLPNAAADRGADFTLDPAARDRALGTISARNEKPLAVYHSHPASPPVPTARQLASHALPDLLLFVISLNTKGVLEMRAFTAGDEPREIPLRIYL